jgi:hypothetical protein
MCTALGHGVGVLGSGVQGVSVYCVDGTGKSCMTWAYTA